MTQRTWILGGLLALAGAAPAAAQRVAEVQVSPAAVTIAVNQQTSVLATAYDANGGVLATAEFEWSSTNPSVVRVETDPGAPSLATLVGLSPGIAEVRAVAGGRRGTVQVQVLAVGGGDGGPPQVGTGTPTVLQIEPSNVQLLPGESRQLIPVFLKDDGSLAAPTPITWSSLAPAVATIDNLGIVTGISEGQGLVELSNPAGLRARAPVEVRRVPISFSLPVLSLSPGAEQTLQVMVPSQGSRALPNNALSWRSTNESVVRVTPLGVARAQAAGQAGIVVQGFLSEDTLPVRVHRPVTELRVSPGPSQGVVVPFGGHREFEITALAADGTPVPDAPMVWTVRDTSLAAFDSETSRLIGKRIGETQLHLRGPGPDIIEATWEVSVVAGGLLISRQAVGMGIGDTVSLRASFTDMEGNPISPATDVTWSSSNDAGATVTASGLVSGLGYGHARILAATPWEAADTMDVYIQGEILVTSTAGGSHDLWAFDRATPTRMNRITQDTAAEVSGAWSPDGSWIAFVSTRGGRQDMYLVRPDGSEWTQLTDTPDVNEDGPAWTPDGRQIVFQAQRRGERFQIWIVNADGTNPRQLTTDSSTNFQPAVSPDGSTIAFTSTRTGNYDVWLMRLDGTEQRNVTQTPGKESNPEYFPNGTLGYIQEQREGGQLTQSVVRKVLASGEVTRVTPPDLPVTEFAISRDGTVLAVQTTAFGQQGGMENKIYLVPLTGAAPTEIPRGAGVQHLGPAFRK